MRKRFTYLNEVERYSILKPSNSTSNFIKSKNKKIKSYKLPSINSLFSDTFKDIRKVTLNYKEYSDYLEKHKSPLEISNFHKLSLNMLTKKISQKNSFYELQSHSANNLFSSIQQINNGKKNKVFKLTLPLKKINDFPINLKRNLDQNIIFNDFCSMNFLENSELLKKINIDEYNDKYNINLLYNILEQDKENYENDEYNKVQKFKYKGLKGDYLNFILDIHSFVIYFYDKQDSNNIIKLNLPFSFIPLFYLTDYKLFKNFISEIITYNEIENKLNINFGNNIIKKYISLILLNKKENKTELSYFKNVNHYIFLYDFSIISENNNENKLFEMKIVLPRIHLREEKYNVTYKKYIEKITLMKLLDKNFLDWETIILFELFILSNFRKSISNILIQNQYNSINKNIYLDSLDSSKMRTKEEFFIRKGKINYYYYSIPISIFYKENIDKENYFNILKVNSIELSQLESENFIYMSLFWGTFDTLKQCMKFRQEDEHVSFNFDLLNNVPEQYYSTQTRKELPFYSYRINKYNIFNCAVIIREPLLVRLIIRDNFKQLKYYKFPKNFLINNVINKGEFSLSLKEYSYLILTSNEIFLTKYENLFSKSDIGCKSRKSLIDLSKALSYTSKFYTAKYLKKHGLTVNNSSKFYINNNKKISISNFNLNEKDNIENEEEKTGINNEKYTRNKFEKKKIYKQNTILENSNFSESKITKSFGKNENMQKTLNITNHEIFKMFITKKKIHGKLYPNKIDIEKLKKALKK